LPTQEKGDIALRATRPNFQDWAQQTLQTGLFPAQDRRIHPWLDDRSAASKQFLVEFGRPE
jgi:hypothetical protein